MTTNRSVNTSVGYTVNTQSVAAVQAANQQVAASFATVQGQAVQFSAAVLALNPQLATAINTSVVAPMQAASAATQNLIRDIGDLGNDIKAIPEPPMSAFGLAEDAGGGGGLGGARSGFRAAGGLVGAAAGGGSFREAGQLVTLVSVLGPLGLVAGGAAIALRAVTAAEQAETDAIKARLDEQRQAAHEVAALGAQEIIAKRDAAQKALEIDQDVARQQTANAALYQLTIVSNPLKLGASIAGLDAQTNAWNDELAKNNVAIAADQAQVNSFTDAINANAGAAVDAATRQQTIAQHQLTDDELRQKVDQEDSQQRQTRIAELQREIAINRDDARIHADNHDTVVLLGEEYLKLTRELEFTSEVTDTYADGLKRVADQTQAISNFFDAVTADNEAIQRVIEAQNNLTQAESEHADKLREIATDEQAKEVADRAKAAQQAEEDQAKYLQKLAEIDAQYNADHEAAVGNRDALANYRAAQKRDDDTAKENATYTLQEQQLQAHLAQQLADDQAAQQKQIAAENLSYTRRNAQLVQALNNAQVEESRAAGLALAYQRQANDVQLNERIRANNASVVIEQNANTVAYNAEVQHQQNMISAAYYGAATIETAFVNLMQRIVGIVGGALTGGGGTTALGINNNGGNYLTGYGSVSAIQAIVNAQVANMVREANR